MNKILLLLIAQHRTKPIYIKNHGFMPSNHAIHQLNHIQNWISIQWKGGEGLIQAEHTSISKLKP